jgi:hypothetical protein
MRESRLGIEDLRVVLGISTQGLLRGKASEVMVATETLTGLLVYYVPDSGSRLNSTWSSQQYLKQG